jgi:hypothetical protein
MKFLYRISNNSYNKPKLENATKEQCFINFLHNVPVASDSIEVLADNVTPELKSFIEAHLPVNGRLIEINVGSNGASFRKQVEMACELPDDEIVMLHEDDYLYRPHVGDTPIKKFNQLVIAEGLQKADYVSLYDHPDKYLPRLQIDEGTSPSVIPTCIDHPLIIINGTQWGNPNVNADGVENMGVFLTDRTHWKYTNLVVDFLGQFVTVLSPVVGATALTNSTTLTFATYVKTLKEDYPVWERNCRDAHPHDFWAFTDLVKSGKKIATPIPGLATNTEYPWISPFYDWSKV